MVLRLVNHGHLPHSPPTLVLGQVVRRVRTIALPLCSPHSTSKPPFLICASGLRSSFFDLRIAILIRSVSDSKKWSPSLPKFIVNIWFQASSLHVTFMKLLLRFCTPLHKKMRCFGCLNAAIIISDAQKTSFHPLTKWKPEWSEIYQNATKIP